MICRKFHELEEKLSKYGLQAKANPLPAYINKVLLEHSHVHFFIYCLGLFLYYNVKAEYCKGSLGATPKIFTLLALYSRNLLTPTLGCKAIVLATLLCLLLYAQAL